ncbi:n-acetylglutamate synthase [Eudoraea chungangensis]|uniref:n-acetylglutamate synthase n=1 Tax=Eudoraea chungangensis TaxID=1481905 RepID=UPI0023EB3BA4|nr:n-acetylglutamate synthase [Eudoraea chungangensis]
MNYNNKRFRLLENSINAETSEKMVFEYKQDGSILTSNYSGGKIIQGHLIGLVNNDGAIEMRYHQVNVHGELRTGKCSSKPEVMLNGKIRLYETWEWTSGDRSRGRSVLEEL